jgi:hypothetical protein
MNCLYGLKHRENPPKSEISCVDGRLSSTKKGAASFASRRAKLYPQEERGIQRAQYKVKSGLQQ